MPQALLATWAGDEAAFAALQKPLLQNLRKTRPRAKHDNNISLAIPLNFRRYSHVKADKNKKLLHQPVLHMFIVACDNSQMYKTNYIRESLINWYKTLQNDYAHYNYKQQAIVITIIGDIPRQSQIRNLDEISVENLETLSINSDSSGISAGLKREISTVSNSGTQISTASSTGTRSDSDRDHSNSLSMSSSANYQPSSRLTFSKSQPVAEIIMKDLSAVTAEFEYPNSCYITTLNEPLRTSPKSIESWTKLCQDIGIKFSSQFYTLVQNHQNLIEDLRIQSENLSYFEYLSTQEHLALAYNFTECYSRVAHFFEKSIIFTSGLSEKSRDMSYSPKITKKG